MYKRDKEWLEYFHTEDAIILQYVCHKEKGTTMSLFFDFRKVICVPFVIDNLPVSIRNKYYRDIIK